MERINKIKKIVIIILAIILILITLVSIILCIYNKNKLKRAKIQDENIVFFGDSIIKGYNVKEFFENNHVVNDGVGGNKTIDLIERLEGLYDYNPSLVIILIGTNDINANISDENIINNIEKIIDGIRNERKNAYIYIQSIYPINKEMGDFFNNLPSEYNNKHIIKVNKLIKQLCKKKKVTYINVYDSLKDSNGNLKSAYTKEGLHLNDLGYYKVTNVLKKYIKKEK